MATAWHRPHILSLPPLTPGRYRARELQESLITRTWVAMDACGNATSCTDVAAFPDSAVATLSYDTLIETLFEYNTPGHELADGANIDWTMLMGHAAGDLV